MESNIIIILQLVMLVLIIFKKDKIIKVKEPYVMYDFKDRQDIVKIDQPSIEVVEKAKENNFKDFSHISDEVEREYMHEAVNVDGKSIKQATKEFLNGGETF